MKTDVAGRASADRKHCGFRLSKDPDRAINKVHSRGELRQHRDDTRRKTVKKPTEEIVERAPLSRRWGLRPWSDDNAATLRPCRSHDVAHDDWYLPNTVSLNMRVEPGLSLQLRGQYFYKRAGMYIS